MASPFTELEVLTILFSLLVFALFTLTGMLEECARSNDLKIPAVILPVIPAKLLSILYCSQMELPFSGFELTFIVVAFAIFSLFCTASVCIQPEAAHPEEGVYEAKKFNRKQRVITKQAGQKPLSKSPKSLP